MTLAGGHTFGRAPCQDCTNDRSLTRRVKPSRLGSDLFVHARHLRIRIRDSAQQ